MMRRVRTTPRDGIFELFMGATADALTRETARERARWISENIVGTRVLQVVAGNGALAALLARALGAGAHVLALTENLEASREADAMVDDMGEPLRSQVRYQPVECLWDGGVGSESFDACVVTGLFRKKNDDGARRVLASALEKIRSGGRILLAEPLGTGASGASGILLDDLVSSLRASVSPLDLFVRGGYVHFAGEMGLASPDRWATFASAESRVVFLEGALADVEALNGRRVEEARRESRAFVAGVVRRARSSQQALRSTLEQNVRLRQALDRTRRSARYQLGSIFMTAARPSVETLKLPARLLEIYRSKTANRPITGRDDRTPDVEPRKRLLDARFDKFLRHARDIRAGRMVVSYSGTSAEGIRANRPYAMARVFVRRGIPVFFGYQGLMTDEALPSYDEPLLFESPIDYTTLRFEDLASADLGEAARTLVISYPLTHVARHLNTFNAEGWVTVYDCLDDWEEFAGANFASWYSSSAEKFIVSNADFSCCVSGPLREKIQSFAETRDVHLLPNAYDRGFLAEGYVPRRGRAVKVGYFGHLTGAWFDWAGLRAIATRRPEYQFDIIGHGAPPDLDVPANVRMLGPKRPVEICRIAEEWHAAIIPFKMGRLADAVDPIKIYEYLALRLSVVSFRMPQIAPYPYTSTVNSVEEFVAALDHAIETRPDDSVIERFLAENTWEERASRLIELADGVSALGPMEKTFHVGKGRS